MAYVSSRRHFVMALNPRQDFQLQDTLAAFRKRQDTERRRVFADFSPAKPESLGISPRQVFDGHSYPKRSFVD
ncbi:hypothetical protein HZ326_30008 [Fusarium oxysporum f. sp. albedinis]|nr:hypothetical protein HZ326_30008 [Fusarium oxysporum f. sp. albedinis]